jgi:photosystem II stability/assembly factor-like uncharacterized protein
VRFVDARDGFLAGPGGVWASTDAGGTWRPIWQDHDVMQLDAVDREHLWAVELLHPHGTRSALFRSIDGGREWERMRPSANLVALSMGDDDHGWAITGHAYATPGSEPDLVPQAGAVLRTSDGGRRWHATGIRAQSVCAAGPEAAWASDGTSVLRTTDGGVTWSSRTLYPTRWYGWGTIGCDGASVAWDLASGGGSMSQQSYLGSFTDDAGRTWTPLLHEPYFPLPPAVAPTHAEIDASSGPFDVVSGSAAFFGGSCSACERVSVTATLDGGRHFHRTTLPDPSPPGFAAPLSISFVDARVGWFLLGLPSGSINQLWRTTDGAHTWKRLGEVPRP